MDLNILLLIVIPLTTAFLIPLVDLVNVKLRRFMVLISVISEVLIVLRILINNYKNICSGDFFLQYHLGGWKPPLGINLVMDGFSLIFVVLITFSLLLVILYSIGYIGHHEGKYYVLVFLSAAAAQGTVLTGDMFNIYVFIEMLTITSAALIAFQRDQNSSEAGIKYLVYNIIGGLFIFFGVLLMYYNLGSLNMAEISKEFKFLPENVQLMIVSVFLMGILIKIGIFPFHFWMPKTYDASPAPITALLSGIISKVYLYIFIRIFWTVIGFEIFVSLNLNTFLINLALFSSFLGHVFALQADNIKRLLAYSSIGHIGMIFAVLMLNTEAGFYGGMWHIVAHMFMKAGLFIACGYLLQFAVSNEYKDFKGIGLRNKTVFVAFIIMILSMIGMPPLIGFASKWYILLAFLEAKNIFGAFIVIFGSLTAVIYYLRYIAQGFQEVKLTDDDLKKQIYNRPLLSVFYREKIVSFISYAFTFVIIFLGFSFRFFEVPLKISIIEIMNAERYIELILGG
ncbi:MAG: complex I subunit 5 family protein [Bacillota bacterium]